MKGRTKRRGFAAVLLAGATMLAFGSTAVASQQPAAKAPTGTLKVLITAGEWPTLDPATDSQDTADAQLLSAIYGELFEFGPAGKVLPDEASGYTLSDGNKRLVITLKSGIKFANGTTMTAADVAASIKRDLLPANGCLCDADFAPVKTITASGQHITLQMSTPDSAIVTAFNDTAPDWTVPMSLVKTAADVSSFDQKPVGAGPFGDVVSNTANASLVLAANKHYWDKGEPKLAKLVFTSVGSDESAYASLETGQSQVALDVSTIPVIKSAMHSSKVNVVRAPADAYEFVSLNDKIPPFNNIKAREALLYATNAPALVKALYSGLYTVAQAPTAPGETFYNPKVPNYPTYNLAKAKSLLAQIPGGITINLATTINTVYWTNEAAFLAAQWSKAGIKATVLPNTLAETLQQLQTNNWTALLSNWGGLDPGVSLPTYFASNGPFSGIHSNALDALLTAGISVKSPSARDAIYKRIDEQMAVNADADFLYSKPFFDFTTKSVTGILSTQFDIFWEDVSD